MKILVYPLVVIGCYLLGSISPSIIISNSIAKRDIREFGSGNAGSTNMLRTFGWKLGMLTFLLDVIKGAAAALICLFLSAETGDSEKLLVMLGCIAAILGHGFPVYYKFRGGKGVASALGIFFVIMPLPTLGALGVSLILIICTRMVSVGSIIGMLLCSAGALIFLDNRFLIITVVVLSLFSFYLHRENISRIFKGTERRLDFSKIKS